MGDINLRNVDDDFIRRAKSHAALSGLRLKHFILEAIEAAMQSAQGRVDQVDVPFVSPVLATYKIKAVIKKGRAKNDSGTGGGDNSRNETPDNVLHTNKRATSGLVDERGKDAAEVDACVVCGKPFGTMRDARFKPHMAHKGGRAHIECVEGKSK